MNQQSRVSRLATVQGAFYLASGLWPIVSYPTFESVTGRKKEPWLVKTVGLVIVAMGITLLRGRRRPGPVVIDLGRMSALALASIDVWYAGVRGCISPVYLVDALAEASLAVAWTAAVRESAAASADNGAEERLPRRIRRL